MAFVFIISFISRHNKILYALLKMVVMPFLPHMEIYFRPILHRICVRGVQLPFYCRQTCKTQACSWERRTSQRAAASSATPVIIAYKNDVIFSFQESPSCLRSQWIMRVIWLITDVVISNTETIWARSSGHTLDFHWAGTISLKAIIRLLETKKLTTIQPVVFWCFNPLRLLKSGFPTLKSANLSCIAVSLWPESCR